MKKVLIVLVSLMMATAAFAQIHGVELAPNGNGNGQPANGFAGSGGGGGNLTFHNGGVVIRNANLVCIFWGPSFTGADAGAIASIADSACGLAGAIGIPDA